MNETAKETGIILKKYGLTLGAVESATGGLISSLITDVPGSSDYFQGSIVSYSNEIKMKIVGVRKETLEKYGAVSSQVAEEMAAGGRRALGVDICVADTGIAGPTGASRDKPLGLFYLGISHKDGTYNRRHIFKGNREQNKMQAALTALNWVKEYLSSIDHSGSEESTFQTKQVVTSFLESNGRIMLVRRSSKVGTYRGQWSAISGYIENNADEQALTEIREETGLSEKQIKLIKKGKALEVIDWKLKTKWIVNPYLFAVTDPMGIRLDWENRELSWVKPEELDKFSTVPKLKDALYAVWEG